MSSRRPRLNPVSYASTGRPDAAQLATGAVTLSRLMGRTAPDAVSLAPKGLRQNLIFPAQWEGIERLCVRPRRGRTWPGTECRRRGLQKPSMSPTRISVALTEELVAGRLQKALKGADLHGDRIVTVYALCSSA